ncbi:MAG: phosphatidate cytidylyltransferase [Bacteroidota bacterium]|nr:phosphatidate cytidylyltransferase [Bacteroidota bacterium]
MSAAVFVVLLIGCVYWNYLSFTIFFFAVSMIGLNEFYKIAEKLGAKPLKIVGFLIGILTYFFFVSFSNLTSSTELIIYKITGVILPLIIIGPFILFSVALFTRNENAIQSTTFTIGGIIYAVLPFALLNQTVLNTNSDFEPELILGIIFLIWSNDTFAYLGGSLFGKNKMIERVSPGKTWEGTIIGVLITFTLSFAFNTLIFKLENHIWPTLGIAIPILATIGDLVESKLKREAGIKDSGSIMPGHGGVLDRFDSLIFVSPFVYAFFKL